MGEEVRTDEERVTEWEKGLPNLHDLTPLSMALIPPELASAFSISPEPLRTLFDVNRASRNTLSLLRSNSGTITHQINQPVSSEVEDVEEDEEPERDGSGSDSRKHRKIDSVTEEVEAEADSAVRTTETIKRPRLVWTPQLHKRFVDVVAHLGIKNAVPKTIMQLMNVEGLTRENVASHLQKYRLYLKRMQGLSNDAPSSSDHLFASTPVPQSLHETGSANHSHSHSNANHSNGGHGNGHGNSHSHSHSHHSVTIPMPYPPPPSSMMSMPPMIGMGHHPHGHMGMSLPPPSGGSSSYRSHPFNMMHHRDWPPNPHSHPHMSSNDSNK